MTNEEKKEFLNGYRRSCVKQRKLQEKLDTMVELDSSVPTQDLSDMPKGGKGQQDLSNMMVKREKIYEELRKEKEKGIHEKKKIKTVIFNVSDARWIRLFTLRYLDLKDWMEVSKEMKYAIRHIHRMHKKALDNLVVNTKK